MRRIRAGRVERRLDWKFKIYERGIMGLIKSIFLSLFVFLSSSVNAAPPAKIDWNDSALNWLSYEQGMSQLKNSGKRGILIMYADWCGTCKAYSKLFKNPEVVSALEGLVLIRANVDADPALSRKYGEDGEYVPRTFAIDPDGGILKDAYGKQGKFAYYIPADNPDDLLRFLKRVRAKKH